MNGPGHSPFVTASECVGLLRAREASLGSYFGDGPDMQKLENLAKALTPIIDSPEAVDSRAALDLFRASVEAEMSWIIPEKDPLAAQMIPTLKEIQRVTGEALVAVDPTFKENLERLANLHIVANAAARQSKLRGNGISFRLAAARVLNAMGARRTAEKIADSVIRGWQR